MKKISFFVLLALLTSCGQGSTNPVNSPKTPIDTSVETAVETPASKTVESAQNTSDNSELRAKLEKMQSKEKISFSEFYKETSMNLGVGMDQNHGNAGISIGKIIGDFVELGVSYGDFGGHTEVFAIGKNRLVSVWSGQEYPVSRRYCEPYLRMGISKEFNFMRNCDKNLDVKVSSLNNSLKKDQELNEEEFLELTRLPNSDIKSARVEDIFGNDNEYVTFAIVSKEDFGYLGFYERKDGIYKHVFNRQETLDADECEIWSRE